MNEANPHSIIVGVDTHKHTHAAVAVTGLGARVGELTIRVGLGGYRELEAWAQSLGTVRAFGIEGTGSYGAGLARFLCAAGHTVHEAGRPDRGLRHRHGKTDHLDAESAACAVLGGQVTALPKAGTGEVEMIRHLKVARDTAVKARTQAMLALKAIIVSAPAALREQLDALAGKMALVRHLAALRPGPLTTPTASAKTSLRAIARRWLDLDAEIGSHDAHLGQLTEHCAPEMVAAHGMGTATAAEMLMPGPGLERQDQQAQAEPRRAPAGQRRPPSGACQSSCRADLVTGFPILSAGVEAVPERVRLPRCSRR
jgi:transposase